MLAIRITMLEGRDDAQIEALHERLAAAAAERLGWPLEDVRTLVHELPARNWGIAGRSVAERADR